MSAEKSISELIAEAAKTHGDELVRIAVRNTLQRLANKESWVEANFEFVQKVAELVLAARRAVTVLETTPDSCPVEELELLLPYFENGPGRFTLPPRTEPKT